MLMPRRPTMACARLARALLRLREGRSGALSTDGSAGRAVKWMLRRWCIGRLTGERASRTTPYSTDRMWSFARTPQVHIGALVDPWNADADVSLGLDAVAPMPSLNAEDVG
mmetsp:Transcript_21646/g.74345  ORF Transcript_21646/g.74345 Transcript_21646/m.74345 type:complete len:111 (-) Transcript_21646:109-441(-)